MLRRLGTILLKEGTDRDHAFAPTRVRQLILDLHAIKKVLMSLGSENSFQGRVVVALLVLRVTLGVFLLVWGIDKFVSVEATLRIWDRWYPLPLTESLTPIIGIGETALAVALIAGLWRRVTYACALLFHALGTMSTWRALTDPWGLSSGQHTTILFQAAVPVLAGFLLLYLLRDWDRWSVDGFRHR